MAWTADLRFALRRLRRAPAFAVATTLMLALGIGLSVAMYSVVRGVMLEGLPFPQSDRVVQIDAVNARQADRGNLTPAEALELAGADPTRSPYQRVGYFNWGGITLFDGEHPRESTIVAVSDGFFATLGVAPALGRWFAPEDHGRKDTVVLSYLEWQRLLGGRADAIGATIDTSDGPLRVVGVMPAGFDYPAPQVGAWLARAPYRSDSPAFQHARFVNAVGRLRDGIDAAGADALNDAVAGAVRARFALPDDGWRLRGTPVLETIVGDVRGALWGALAIALLVLGIACVNVYLLFDARQLARAGEIQVTHALGASRGRVFRTHALELALLAGAGTLGGVALARLAIEALRGPIEATLPRVGAIAVDDRVLWLALVLGALPALAVAAAEAWRERDRDAAALRSGRGVLGGARAQRTVPALALALSTVSLVAAAALGLSMLRLMQVEPGFHSENVRALQLFRGAKSDEELAAFAAQLTERIAAVPGVTGAALTGAAPLARNGVFNVDMQVHGRARPEEFGAALRRVDAGYLPLLGIPVVAGRGIEATDRAGGERVAVVNRELARRVFGAEAAALGQTLELPLGNGPRVPYRVVGVTADIRNDGLRAPPSPEILISFAQTPWGGMTVLARTRGPIEGIERALAAQVWAIDPREAISREYALADDLDQQLSTVRFFALTVGGFALLALFLGAFGVYAVASQQQRLRVREFGLRLAVGARPAALGGEVLRQGVVVVAIGAALGVLGAFAVLRLLAAQTFGLDAQVHWVMLAGVAAMALAALAALMLPAWRAIRTDAMVALRHE